MQTATTKVSQHIEIPTYYISSAKTANKISTNNLLLITNNKSLVIIRAVRRSSLDAYHQSDPTKDLSLQTSAFLLR